MGKADDFKKPEANIKENLIQQRNTVDLLSGLNNVPQNKQAEKVPKTAKEISVRQNLERFTLRIDPRLKEAMEILAVAEARSLNTIAALAIKEFIEKKENLDAINDYKANYIEKK